MGAVAGEAAAVAYNGDRNVLVEGIRPGTVEFARLIAGSAGSAGALTGNDVNASAAAGGNVAANNLLGTVQRGVAICMEVAACRDRLALTVGGASLIAIEAARIAQEHPELTPRAINAMAVSTVLATAWSASAWLATTQ